MIQDLRQNSILEELNNNEILYIKDLVELFDVSESTIRRDIKVLEGKNLVVSLRGGGVRAVEDVEKSYYQKTVINSELKDKIGKKAAKLVKNGDYIYIDSGTTPLAMVKYIDADRVTIVTSNIMITEFLPKQGIKCIVLGGFIEDKLSSIVGSYAEKMLEDMFFDKAFIGSNGYVEGEAYYTFDERESRKKSLAIKNSQKAYILADSSKKNRRGFSKFADFEGVELISE